MDWSENHTRITVIGLHKVGKNGKQIFSILKSLNISQKFVYRTIQRFNETGDVLDRPRTGRPRTARSKQIVEAVRSRIRRNPIRKQTILAREMKIAPRTVSRILRDDLRLRAYKRYTGHLLTDKLKQIRYKRSKKLIREFGSGRYQDILFTDEKIFTVEETYNKQNDRVYARSSYEAKEKVPRIQRGHHPASVMVWWGVSYHGASHIHFCEKGVKTSAKVYQEMLTDVVKPLNTTLFKNKPWVFQQDSAPGHKAKTTQRWLENNVPAFIRAEDWPSGSPDLNPLDYCLWSLLEQKACSKPHRNVEALKTSLTKAVAEIPLETLRTAIDDFIPRLKLCVKAKGGHFE